jgi:hypothetical protein
MGPGVSAGLWCCDSEVKLVWQLAGGRQQTSIESAIQAAPLRGFILHPSLGCWNRRPRVRNSSEQKDRAETLFSTPRTTTPGRGLAATGGLSTKLGQPATPELGGALGPRNGIAIFRRGLPPTRGSALNASPKRTRCRFQSPVSKKLGFLAATTHNPNCPPTGD